MAANTVMAFGNSLDTIERVRTLVAFFVEAHNAQMPHAAFRGHTPEEMYFAIAVNLPTELAEARKNVRLRQPYPAESAPPRFERGRQD